MSKSSKHNWTPGSDTKTEFTDFAGCIWKCKIIREKGHCDFIRIMSKNQMDLIPRLVRLTVSVIGWDCSANKSHEKKLNFQSQEALFFDTETTSSSVTYCLEFLEPEKFIYSLFSPPSTFSKDFKSLLDSGKLSDVKLRAGDFEVNAHKIILASRSPVFKAMFSYKSKENIENVVEIKDFDADVVKKLLDYIYTDYFNLHEKSEEVRAQLYQAADKYHMDRLKSLCEDMLVRNLTIENAVETLLLADLHKSPELKEKVFSYILANLRQVSETESWSKLLEYPKILSEVLLANLNAKQENW